MPSNDMSGMAQTVLGPVRPEDLGPTTTHEHLLIDLSFLFRPPLEAAERGRAYQPVTIENLGWVSYNPIRNLDNLRYMDEEMAIAEALLFKGAGGGAIVDATTIGIGRDPRALARIARETGLHIVMGAGYYVGASHPAAMDRRTATEIADQLVDEITAGVGDSGVKAGIIGELGCSWPLKDNERKVLEAAARAQQQTGASILVHPGRDTAAPFEILDVLTGSGADISRVIIGHLDRTIGDIGTLLELARRGACLEYDLFGWESSYYYGGNIDMPNDAQRLGFIKKLVDDGYASNIVIAQDICFKHRLTRYGGHGFHHILENIVPRMGEKGISPADVDAIMVANPARLLAFA